MDKAKDPQTRRLVAASSLNLKHSLIQFVCPECNKPVHLREAHQRWRKPYFAHNPGTANPNCSLYLQGEGDWDFVSSRPQFWKTTSDWFHPGIVLGLDKGKIVLGELIPAWAKKLSSSQEFESVTLSWFRGVGKAEPKILPPGFYPLPQKLWSVPIRYVGLGFKEHKAEPLRNISVFRWFDLAWRMVSVGSRLEYGEPLFVLSAERLRGLHPIAQIYSYYLYPYIRFTKQGRDFLLNDYEFRDHSERIFHGSSAIKICQDGFFVTNKRFCFKARPIETTTMARVVWQNLRGMERQIQDVAAFESNRFIEHQHRIIATGLSCPSVFALRAQNDTGIGAIPRSLEMFYEFSIALEVAIQSEKFWQNLAKEWFLRIEAQSKPVVSVMRIETPVINTAINIPVQSPPGLHTEAGKFLLTMPIPHAKTLVKWQEGAILSRSACGLEVLRLEYGPDFQLNPVRTVEGVLIFAWRFGGWRQLLSGNYIDRLEPLILVRNPKSIPLRVNTFVRNSLCFTTLNYASLAKLFTGQVWMDCLKKFRIKHNPSRLVLVQKPQGYSQGLPVFTEKLQLRLVTSSTHDGFILVAGSNGNRRIQVYDKNQDLVSIERDDDYGYRFLCTESLFAPLGFEWSSELSPGRGINPEFDLWLRDGFAHEVEYGKQILSQDFAIIWLQEALRM